MKTFQCVEVLVPMALTIICLPVKKSFPGGLRCGLLILLLAGSVIGARAQVVSNTPGSNSPSALPASTPYAVVSRDANSAVWQRETYEQGPSGTIVTNIHSYVELSTGLNHLVGDKYVPSTEQISISPDGSSAYATNGQHQVYFPGNIYSGMVKLVAPDGKILESQPIGLSYSDDSNSVLLAVVTNATGAILPSGNQVIYQNAFDGLDADLLYRYTKAGMEQDVVLHEQPPDPEALGLNPAKTRLQVLTEFISSPQPSINTTTMPTAAGNLEDDQLSFGVMQMTRGRAFLLGTNSPSVAVDKRWLALNGRQFLIEEVPIVSVARAIDSLPPFVSQATSGTKLVVSKDMILPQQRLICPSPKTQFLAQATPPNRGLVLDYVTVNSQYGITFQGDSTYYISGAVYLDGTNNMLEGGSVIKYAVNAFITVDDGSALNCLASQYRPVILTAVDDNSVGERIAGSTGNPTNYYANSALTFFSSSPTLSNIRIAYAQNAFSFLSPNATLSDFQIVNCQQGVFCESSGLNLDNGLFANVQADISPLFGSTTVNAQNITFNTNTYLSYITYCPSGATYNLTNCILANVANLINSGGVGQVTVSGTANGFYNSPEFGTGAITNNFYPFQTVGGGSCYLTNGCNFFNAGTTNIDPTLLADLQTKTTYPPVLLTNQTIAISTNLSRQAPRDANGSPDLGYHYDPLDYIADNFAISNAVLTVTNGTAIASYNRPGIQLQDGSSIVSIGSPLFPNWFVRYSSVQEQPAVLAGTNLTSGLTVSASPYGSVGPTGQYRFSKFACPASCGYLFNDAGTSSYGNLLVQDSELWCGANMFNGNTNTATAFLNDLLCRSDIYALSTVPTSLSFSNNLIIGTTVFFYNQAAPNTWRAFNNAFDRCGIWYIDHVNIGHLTNGYNAYLNCYGFNGYVGELYPTDASDIVPSLTLIYQTGPLGTFYQPTWYNPLIHMGSTNANLVGLYHYTVTTNEVIEGTNIVSIGYHYVAVDQYGNPLDSNGDGIPDYLEDPSGSGGPLTIALVAPANNSYFREPATIPMQATVFDWSGTVTNVTFSSGPTNLTTLANPPYNCNWPIVAAGSYTVQAKAFDNNGATANSSTASVTVTNLCH